MGEGVGDFVGDSVGFELGTDVGFGVGFGVGLGVGDWVGVGTGSAVGVVVGKSGSSPHLWTTASSSVTIVFPGELRESDSFEDMSWHVAPRGYLEATSSQESILVVSCRDRSWPGLGRCRS